MSDTTIQSNEYLNIDDLTRLFTLTEDQIKSIQESGQFSITEAEMLDGETATKNHSSSPASDSPKLKVGATTISGMRSNGEWLFPAQEIYQTIYDSPTDAKNDRWVTNETLAHYVNLQPSSISNLVHVFPSVNIAGEFRTSQRLLLKQCYTEAEIESKLAELNAVIEEDDDSR